MKQTAETAARSTESTKRQINQSKILSRVTAGIVVFLLIIFFMNTIGTTTTMLNQVEILKERQYPASIAAGRLETRLVQLRTLASQAVYLNSEAAADNMLLVNKETYDEMWELIDTICDSSSIENEDAEALKNGYATLTEHMDQLASMVRHSSSDVYESDIGTYVNNEVYPTISNLLRVDQSALDQTNNVINDVYLAVNAACRRAIFLAWVLTIGVFVSLFVYLAILHRKTQREKLLTDELEEALTQAQGANRAKSVFLSSMSHDIRTPMNAIMGLTTIARANLDDRARVENCLDRITTSSNHLLSLVNDILDMSEIENGHIELNEDTIDLPDLMDKTITIMQTQARIKDIELGVTVGPLEHSMVRGDALRIQQVVLNLAGNAIKYTNAGGWVHVVLVEHPRDGEETSDYCLTVEDSGIGMDAAFLENIFQPFERERNEATSSTEGAGLGMAITKSIVDLMGGTISVESTLGEGSTFTVHMPLITMDPPAQSVVTTPIDPDEPLSGRVLLVEDDPLNREIAIELIQSFGVDVETACDGLEALETYRDVEPDRYGMIFMDFQMPRMGGMEAARNIVEFEQKEGRAHIPIVAMTANAFNEDRQRAIEAGMDGFMSKPISMDQLEKYLRRFLQGKGSALGDERRDL